MAAPKGHPRYGGRKKTVPNFRTAFSVSQRLAEANFDLIGTILHEIEQIDKPFLKARCYLQLLEYCDSKRKAIEMTVEVDQDRERIRAMSDEELAEHVVKNLPEEIQ